jgi:hypothetical protein
VKASARPRAVEELEVTEVEDGLVVYDPKRNRVHYLDPVASVVFTLCDGARNRHHIIEATTGLFKSSDVSTRDVEACVEQLEDERVLQPDA